MKIRLFQIKDRVEVHGLLRQLVPYEFDFSEKYVRKLISDKSSICLVGVAENGKVIAFGQLIKYVVVTEGLVGRIEDLIVDEPFRDKGYGTMLMKALMKKAFEPPQVVQYIDLTSEPKRKAAWALYRKLGFKRKNVGVFRYKRANRGKQDSG